jgi:serine/threonine-protein kinase
VLAKGDRLDRYEIVELLGQGGMGEVYRAYDARLERHVALKIVRDDGTQGTGGRARLLREARAVAALSHPNVLTVHDAGEVTEPAHLRGTTFIAMELVVGDSLRARIGDASVSLDRRIGWLQDAARGLSAAHGIGVVHRDVKPENVMIRFDGIVKVLDFGIARRASAPADAAIHSLPTARTETPVTEGEPVDAGRAGTLAYMAPEQVKSQALDARTDQFAWGVVAYELLTGASPWGKGLDSVALVARILTHVPRSVADVVPGVPRHVSAVVERAMSKEPGDRFATMADLLSALSLPTAPARRGGTALWLAGAVVAAAAVFVWAHAQPGTPVGASAGSSASADPSALHAPTIIDQRRLTTLPHENPISSADLTADGSTFLYSDRFGFWVQPVAGGPRRSLGIPLGPHGAPAYFTLARAKGEGLAMVKDGDALTTWRFSLDGRPPRRLTADLQGTPYAFPVLSPDGTRVAICDVAGALVVTSVDGGPRQRVSEKCPLVTAWSPDGRHLALRRIDTLSVVSADGLHSENLLEDPELLPRMGSPAGMDWPEPGRVIYSRGATGTEKTEVRDVAVDAEGHRVGAPRVLGTVPAIDLGALSAVGDHVLALFEDRQYDVDLGKVAPGGRTVTGDPIRLSGSDAIDRWARWLPDGRVAYYSARDGVQAIYAQAVEGQEAEMLVPPPVAPGPFLVLQGGAMLVRRPVDLDGGSHIDRWDEAVDRLMLRQGDEEREVLRGSYDDQDVHCAGDDPHRCVLVTNDHGMLGMAFVDLVSGTVGPTFWRGPVDRDWFFAVSPDASTVVLARSVSTLTVVPTSGAPDRSFTTTPGVKAEQEVEFAPDGRSVLLAGIWFDQSPYGVGRFDLQGRGTVLVSDANDWLAFPAISRDGKWLAYDRMTIDDDLWLLDVK